MQTRKSTAVIVAALATGALVRSWFVLHHPPFGGDALLYGDLARNMLQHHKYGFTEDEGIRSTLIRLPGYPVFLAAIFAVFGVMKLTAVLWIQVLIDLATCAMAGLLAARLMGARAGIATLWLAAICPFTSLYSAVALTECGCLFFVALAFLSLERWTTAWRANRAGTAWAALIGMALSGGILLRPDQALVAIAVVPTMLWISWRAPNNLGTLNQNSRTGTSEQGAPCPDSRAWVSRMRPPVLASAIIALPLALWGARNWHVFHVIQPLAPRYANDPGEANPYGFQRWYRTWAIDFKTTADLYWTYDGAAISLKDVPARAYDNPAERAETATIYAQYADAGASTPQIDGEFAQLAAERVHDHPLRYYVAMPLLRMLNMWLRPRTEWTKIPLDWWNFSAHEKGSFEALAFAFLNLLYLVLAKIGWWRWRSARWNGMAPVMLAMIVFILLRCALLMTLDNSEPRYTLECFPILFVLAGMAFVQPSKLT